MSVRLDSDSDSPSSSENEGEEGDAHAQRSSPARSCTHSEQQFAPSAHQRKCSDTPRAPSSTCEAPTIPANRESAGATSSDALEPRRSGTKNTSSSDARSGSCNAVDSSARSLLKPNKSSNEPSTSASHSLYEESDDPIEDSDCGAVKYIRLGQGERKWVLQRSIAAKLYEHQRDAVRWLWGLHKKGSGGILGDDMGLGKTLSVSAFLAGLLVGRCISAAIVIAPATLLGQWEKELSLCQCSGIVHRLHGQSQRQRESKIRTVRERGGIVLTTYGMLTHNMDLFCASEGELSSEAGRGWSGAGSAGNAQNSRDGDGSLAFEWLIADEGHKLKNEQSQQAQCVNRVRAERRLLLTGTPIQNNLRELWALFNLCVPGLLGDKQTFKQDFEKVITRGQSREATERERQQGVATSKQLRRKIEPYFRRREKEEVLSQPSEEESAYRSADLIGDELDEISRRSSSTSTANASRQTNTDGRNIPPAPAPKRLGRKNDVVVWLKLSPQQRNVYHAFLTSPSVHAVLNRGGSALSALSVLKKICDHPQLMSEKAMRELSSEPKSHEGSFERSASSAESGELTKGCALQCIEKEARRVLSHPFADVRSCKTEFAIGIAKRFIEDGHRLLMFSQSKEFLDVTERALQSHQIRYSRIDGDVPTDERQRRVDHFKSATLAEVPVFLLTSHVGGLGLNLYEASRVLILDPAWNPSTDNQAVDRIYRIGQEKDVIVMRLISCGTVEEKMYRKQVFKNGLSHASTSDSETMRYFTQEQLSDLFSAPDGALESSETKKQLDELHGGERECSDEVARELEHAESLSWAAGLTDHDMLFSRPDESSTGSGTKGPICIESSESAPAVSGNKSSSKKGASGDAKAPAAAWSGAGSNVSNILSARTQVKQKAKLSLAPTSRHHEASAPATKEEKRANEREYEAKESMHSRGKDDEADENKTLRNELDKVERTLATVQLDKLPDGGGNLHARRLQLQHKLSEQERDEKADSLADEISKGWPLSIADVWMRSSLTPSQPRGQSRHRSGQCSSAMPSSSSDDAALPAERIRAPAAASLEEAAQSIASELSQLTSTSSLANQTGGIARVECPLALEALPDGVATVPSTLRSFSSRYAVYFARRSQSASSDSFVSTAGFGVARLWSGCAGASVSSVWPSIRRFVRSLDGLMALGGGRFDFERDPSAEWSDFGSFTFFVPLLEVTEHPDCIVLACNAVWKPAGPTRQWVESGPDELCSVISDALALLQILITSGPFSAIRTPLRLAALPEVENDRRRSSEKHEPFAHTEWEQQVHGILSEIESDKLRKAVLARQKRLQLRSKHRKRERRRGLDASHWRQKDGYDTIALMSSLRKRERESYSFALELPSGTAFFGCTPEQLLCLSGSTVTSEALAGTRPRTVGREDNELESDLNESAKELQEHAIVRSGIMDAFEDVCEEDSVVSHGRSVRKLRRIQHLYCTISGRIREGTSGEARLLDSLHPTAAVCGSPRVHALNVIRNHEQFDRGLYSGPIGYLSSDGAEIAVGIRSGLLLPDHESVFLYGGVGIVHGADASAEWNETELKIGQLESALQAPPDIDAQPNAQMLWASLAIEELWRCGARDICIAPGSRSAPLALAASRHSHLRVHYCIDERTLGFYALGLAKGTCCTRPIVVITSSGTAVANLLPSAVEAEQSKVPLIFLTADRPPEMQNCGANQTIKQDGIFSTCARFQVTIPGPTDKIPSRFVLTSIDEAFSKALSPQSGPVHVNFELREPLFPTEQADSTQDTFCDLNESWMRSRWPFTSIASQNELLKYAAEVRIPQDILHLLLSAEAGLIICTGLSGQEDVIAAARLASHLGWPLIADVSASAPLDSVARSNWLGSLSLVLSSSKVQDAIGSPDVILQLGVRVTSRSTFAYMERFAADRVSTQWIVVDQSLSRHDPAHHVSHRIELSPSHFAPAVLDALSRSGCDTTSALLDLAYTAADITKEALQASAPALRPSLTDIDVVHHVISTLPARSILFCGNSLSIRDLDVCAVLDMDSDSTLRRESNRGASGIDGLLSTALGIAHSSGRALTAVVGDVSFHHDLNSLRLFQSGHMPAEPVTLVVLSNGGGKVFSELPLAQNVTSEELAQVFETAPSGSIAAMCGAFGIDHQLVRSNHELHPALFHSWSLNSHSVVEIDVSSAAERYPDARKRLRHVATDAVCRRLATQHTCRPWSSSKRVGDVAWCRRSTGDAVLVRLELANSGCAGWGEAAPHNMFSRESCDDIEVQLKRIEKGLTTAHVTSRILGLASGYDAWLETCLGRGQALQLVPSLRFAIETALLSALASEAGLGLHSLLLPETMSASPASAHVLCNSLLTAESDPELRTPLMGDSDVMKIKVGDLGDPEADAERVIRARNAAGANCRIRCDANRQYTYEQALTFMQRIASLENLDYVEEPVDGDGATMGALKARSGVRIAVDESMLEAYREHQDVSGIFSSDAVNVADAFVVKPSAYGSISTCMSLCYTAAMADRQLVVTGAAESSIGLSSVACIAALADATVGRREAHGLSVLDDSLLESDTALTMESRAIPRRGDAGELRMNLAAVAQNMQDGSKQSGGNYAYE